MSAARRIATGEALKAEFGGGCLNLTRFLDIHGILVVEQNGKAAQSGEHLAKQFEPFGGHVRRHNRKAGHITAGPRQTGDSGGCGRDASYLVPSGPCGQQVVYFMVTGSSRSRS